MEDVVVVVIVVVVWFVFEIFKTEPKNRWCVSEETVALGTRDW